MKEVITLDNSRRWKRHLNQRKWHNQRLEMKTTKSSPEGDKELGSGENLEMVKMGDERSTATVSS